jgi:hypothetical protein
MGQKRSLWAAGLIAFAGFSAGVEAAPASPLGRPEARTGDPDVVQIGAYRRCYWLDGDRVCRWYRSPRVRRYGYPEDYKTGSSAWWQEMDRTDRGGRGGRR